MSLLTRYHHQATRFLTRLVVVSGLSDGCLKLLLIYRILFDVMNFLHEAYKGASTLLREASLLVRTAIDQA